jgi:hypothetical protein
LAPIGAAITCTSRFALLWRETFLRAVQGQLQHGSPRVITAPSMLSGERHQLFFAVAVHELCGLGCDAITAVRLLCHLPSFP